jgi:hypothetical protein
MVDGVIAAIPTVVGAASDVFLTLRTAVIPGRATLREPGIQR